jgi:hypothetical protein
MKVLDMTQVDDLKLSDILKIFDVCGQGEMDPVWTHPLGQQGVSSIIELPI